MQNLIPMFERIKTSVGGNREKTGFEYTFGTPLEEREGITPVNRWQKRILSQLEFALTLNDELSGKYDDVLDEAMGGLLKDIEETGTITKAAALAAENTLLPMKEDANAYSVILCAHAHIDMNWMWSWQETVAATLDTFRTMLQIMREYPDFTYSQSQSSVYEIVEKYEPSMMDEIKQRIREGRWEVTAAAWVETDKNMPSTESLARHILYTKQYMRDTWGVSPDSLKVDFSPDTFGHSANLPELNLNGNVEYYYHCRGNNVDHPLYRWRAPSGREVLVYREPYWYNSAITPHIGSGLVALSRKCGGLKTGLIVYGVGDHGGGPTRRDIESALEMMQWPVYPRLRFGTFHEFFKIAESVKEKLPVFDQEINFIFTGCYTTQSRIKLGNRQSEAALYQAEAISALAAESVQAPYDPAQFDGAWRNVLFTHFHDILTGSCVQDTREHAMGLYSHALAVANTQRSQAMRAFAAAIDTSALAREEDISLSQSEGAGAGYGIERFSAPVAERGAGIRRLYHVFNPSAHAHRSVVELTVWDWQGDLRRIEFADSKGNPLAHQLLQRKRERYWDHLYFKVLVEADLPPMGYATIVMDQKELDHYPFYYMENDRTHKKYDNHVLENEYLRAEFCYQTGALVSLIHKADGIELINPKNPACLRLAECDGNSDNAWIIGRYMNVTSLTKNVIVKPIECSGDLRQGMSIEAPCLNSTAKAIITLDRHSKTLQIDLTVDWHEITKGKGVVPTLLFSAPVAYEAGEYLYDVPAGAQRRAAMHMDVPAQTYGAAIRESGVSLAVATDCKYGFRGVDNSIGVTLIHPANHPDLYPERGIHHIHIALFAEAACPKAMREAAFDAVNPPAYISARFGAGTLPTDAALLELHADTTAVISGIKQAEDGSGLIVRLYETCGKATEATLTFREAVAGVQVVDILEAPTDGDARAEGNAVTVSLPAYRMAAVRVSFK